MCNKKKDFCFEKKLTSDLMWNFSKWSMKLRQKKRNLKIFHQKKFRFYQSRFWVKFNRPHSWCRDQKFPALDLHQYLFLYTIQIKIKRILRIQTGLNEFKFGQKTLQPRLLNQEFRIYQCPIDVNPKAESSIPT